MINMSEGVEERLHGEVRDALEDLLKESGSQGAYCGLLHTGTAVRHIFGAQCVCLWGRYTCRNPGSVDQIHYNKRDCKLERHLRGHLVFVLFP